MSTMQFGPHELANVLALPLTQEAEHNTWLRMALAGCEPGVTPLEAVTKWATYNGVLAYAQANAKAWNVANSPRHGTVEIPTTVGECVDLDLLVRYGTGKAKADRDAAETTVTLALYNLDNEGTVEAVTWAFEMTRAYLYARMVAEKRANWKPGQPVY